MMIAVLNNMNTTPKYKVYDEDNYNYNNHIKSTFHKRSPLKFLNNDLDEFDEDKYKKDIVE